MADTDDDEQTMARRPTRHTRGEDGVPAAEAAAEEQRLAERRESWVQAGRTADELAEELDEEELEEELREELELDAREERELRDVRRETDAELADAMRRADMADRNHQQLRARAADERLLARGDSAHAAHLRDGAVGRDDAQSDADLRAADRAQARANSRDRIANDDDRRANWNYAEGREQRSRAEAAVAEAPAAEAVRNGPDEPPVARKNIKRPRRLKEKDSKALRDFGIGD